MSVFLKVFTGQVDIAMRHQERWSRELKQFGILSVGRALKAARIKWQRVSRVSSSTSAWTAAS